MFDTSFMRSKYGNELVEHFGRPVLTTIMIIMIILTMMKKTMMKKTMIKIVITK